MELCSILQCQGGQGSGGVQEVGVEGDGEWDSQGGGKQEKKGKLYNIQYFATEKVQRWELTKIGQEMGLKGTRRRSLSPLSPPPPF